MKAALTLVGVGAVCALIVRGFKRLMASIEREETIRYES
jgi:hypothetical protein